MPEPGPGQLVLAMHAASLNYRDLLMVKGAYNPRQPLPLVPASDGVGEVVAIGAGVSRVAVGQTRALLGALREQARVLAREPAPAASPVATGSRGLRACVLT